MKRILFLIKNCEACLYCNLTEEVDEETKKLKNYCTKENQFIKVPNEIAPFCTLENEE